MTGLFTATHGDYTSEMIQRMAAKAGYEARTVTALRELEIAARFFGEPMPKLEVKRLPANVMATSTGPFRKTVILNERYLVPHGDGSLIMDIPSVIAHEMSHLRHDDHSLMLHLRAIRWLVMLVIIVGVLLSAKYHLSILAAILTVYSALLWISAGWFISHAKHENEVRAGEDSERYLMWCDGRKWK